MCDQKSIDFINKKHRFLFEMADLEGSEGDGGGGAEARNGIEECEGRIGTNNMYEFVFSV